MALNRDRVSPTLLGLSDSLDPRRGTGHGEKVTSSLHGDLVIGLLGRVGQLPGEGALRDDGRGRVLMGQDAGQFARARRAVLVGLRKNASF